MIINLSEPHNEGNKMEEHRVNIGTLIADKIKVRYAEITEKTMGSQNMVVDAFYPTYVRNSLTGNVVGPDSLPVLSKKCSAISPFIANELNVYNIKIDDLTKMLGYTKINLKAMLETIKEKKINLCLVGLGGTGMNFMHWAEEIANYTNSINIFERIMIYDEDIVDLTNIFRFPQILNPDTAYFYKSVKKIHAIPNRSILCTALIKHEYYIKENDLINYGDRSASEFAKNNVFYGAPDIATRELFSSIPEARFISGTHGDNDCQLYIKPVQDSELQVESYGMINLSVFFMNQLKMTIEFLALLASDEDLTTSKLIMEYSFANEYTEKKILKAGLNRTYNFPIQKESIIDQEVNIESSEPQAAPETSDDSIEENLDSVAIPMPVYPMPPQPPLPPLRDNTVATTSTANTISSAIPALFEMAESLQPSVTATDMHDTIRTLYRTALDWTDAQANMISEQQFRTEEQFRAEYVSAFEPAVEQTSYAYPPNAQHILDSLISTVEPEVEQASVLEEIAEPPVPRRRTRRTPAQMAEARREEEILRRAAEAPQDEPEDMPWDLYTSAQ
jgi:hypothetical protein